MHCPNDEKIIATYRDMHGEYYIVKSDNGKIFNRYMPNHGLVGPFKTRKDAELMMKRHRPYANLVVDRLPKNYYLISGATNAPRGYAFATNRESFFSGKKKYVLVKKY